jgi:hypothetical protein
MFKEARFNHSFFGPTYSEVSLMPPQRSLPLGLRGALFCPFTETGFFTER